MNDLIKRLREQAELKPNRIEAAACVETETADRLTAMKAAGDGLAGLAVHTKQCPIIKGWGQAGNCTCGLTDALKQWKEASDGL